ncbi:MAG TPA: hypothetical protein VGY98_17810, partial [Verrucomicrobiae bacterium]|nr:hypothetical protein [Verrucomicrobiae bacterium]
MSTRIFGEGKKGLGLTGGAGGRAVNMSDVSAGSAESDGSAMNAMGSNLRFTSGSATCRCDLRGRESSRFVSTHGQKRIFTICDLC